MSKLLIGFIPLLAAVLVMIIRLRRGKIFAFLLAFLVYFILAMAIAIFLGAVNFSSYDPQLVAGAIAENIASALLLAVFEIPILAVIFWAYKWWEARQSET
ncbi:MAG: hypothetical protein JKY25_11295 [Robiginitomaculum sp.]|nr:hypothetical protein [Robiginitomaculum sp.]